ncbi:CMP-N-acetylneuraminic acid synthetase [Lachnotalea glycerini]|uniref:N-acylneuraminate cytidylyltransferase n=2 Tax=Lachnotalea glycerini TaxID=1763509 RepID=A0A318EU12_9FIRM|nr:CMP-N-acetylneuraminic acid synthetase [Lachnotalea glycerini]
MSKVLAIIPARSGSKSVKNKNIREINGKPMIAYSIEHAKASKLIDRVIVSTDSEVYAKIAREYGAETPFIRPAEYALDTSLDLEVFEHALSFLEEKEGYIPDLVVQLRPTYPIRKVQDIDNMITRMLGDKTIDSMRCIAPAKEISYKMWHKLKDGSLSPIMKEIKECYNMPRQQLPDVFYQNACIDVIRTDVITKNHSMSGDKIVGYEMEENFDIDTEEEFRKAEEYLKITSGNKTFVFDIDGVVAKLQKNLDYALSEPNEPMIEIMNQLYDYGNKIVLFTARGYVTGKDWSEITKEQMKRWGVQYHELKFGKPNADYYVDDKMLSMESLYQMFVK